jgi:hypothetical protein
VHRCKNLTLEEGARINQSHQNKKNYVKKRKADKGNIKTYPKLKKLNKTTYHESMKADNIFKILYPTYFWGRHKLSVVCNFAFNRDFSPDVISGIVTYSIVANRTI